jgi:hypothetical protein
LNIVLKFHLKFNAAAVRDGEDWAGLLSVCHCQSVTHNKQQNKQKQERITPFIAWRRCALVLNHCSTILHTSKPLITQILTSNFYAFQDGLHRS